LAGGFSKLDEGKRGGASTQQTFTLLLGATARGGCWQKIMMYGNDLRFIKACTYPVIEADLNADKERRQTRK